MTLLCAYFGAWHATVKYGVPEIPGTQDGPAVILSADAPIPFVVRQKESDNGFVAFGNTFNGRAVYADPKYRYYLWFFGHRIRLPFESREADESDSRDSRPQNPHMPESDDPFSSL